MQIRLLLGIMLILILPNSAFAILSMELTRGTAGATPIAVIPFAIQSDAVPPQDVSHIIENDLRNSGRFKVYGRADLKEYPSDARDISANYFRRLGTDNVLLGKITALKRDRYHIFFQLLDMYHANGDAKVVLSKQYTVTAKELRAVAHRISDLVFERLMGVRGVFSTKLAYVLVQRSENGVVRYVLEVSDQDGYNPRPLLTSNEPIMSPAWSPNGKQLAYVSFENYRASIFVQDIATGARQLLSEFPGINGAPAWSPDGKKLALVLSKSGSPNIYIMDVATRHLTPVTNDFYINTEPAWTDVGFIL